MGPYSRGWNSAASKSPYACTFWERLHFPPDTAVIVIVCSDAESRKTWVTPSADVEADCLNFRFLTRGVFFRAMMGWRLPEFFRDRSCTSPRKCLFYGSAKHRIPEISQMFGHAS